MLSRRFISGVVLLGVLAAAPTFADEGQRRRSEGDGRNNRPQQQSERAGRAVPRSRAAARPDDGRREQAQQAQVQRQYRAEQQVQAQRQYRERQQAQTQRQYRADRQHDARRDYAVRRDYRRPYYPSYSYRGYGSRTIIVPRYITPRFVTVVPYRPYVYRPSIGIGVYYGSGGSYPYGYTPRGYYDPIVGHPYGGLRITGASQLAQVFADGYYVGIVNDFDGVFQHLNLEAGPHQIEIREPGVDQPLAFDVNIQAGRTITFRADQY